MIFSTELSNTLDSVDEYVIGYDGGNTETAGEYTFFSGKGNENHELGTGFLGIREPYQQLRRLSLLVIGCHTTH
jgi:hypothetical protein